MTAAARAFRPARPGRTLLAALAAVLCVDVLTALVVLAYGNTYLLRTLGAAPAAPAFALTIYGAVKLLIAPLSGRVVDGARVQTVLVLIVAIELASLALIVITRSAPGYFVGVGGLASGIATSWIVAFRALGAATDAEQRGTVASTISVVSGAATGVGFGLAAVIAELGPWWLPFALGMPLGLASAVLLRSALGPNKPAPAIAPASDTAPAAAAVVPRADRPGADAHGSTAARAGAARAGARARNTRIAAAGVVFGHFSIVTGLLVLFWPFTLALLGLSPLRATLLLLPAAASGGAALLLSGRWSRPGRRLPLAALLYAIAAGGLAAIAGATNGLWFALAAALIAPALAGAQPVLIASMIDISRAAGRSGMALGWIFSAEASGAIAGPAAVGVAIELWGVRAGVITIACGAALLAAIAAAASRRVRL